MSQGSFEKGLAKRRKVMGDAFVDRALSQADELTM
ncbi:MAG: 4-carboxymuconolactone decarboxylase, partial [Gammaproteobacteria bacterium]|nr:4-carboxymuconolactone decarboxylase [Gammaproteobacteria bacterium]